MSWLEACGFMLSTAFEGFWVGIVASHGIEVVSLLVEHYLMGEIYSEISN